MSKAYSHTTTFTVYFYHTDAAGVVHHSNYVNWYEAGRIEFLKQLGFPYEVLQQQRIGFSPVSLSLHYLYPLRLGDVFTVHTTFTQINKASILVEAEIHLKTQIVNRCQVKLACLNEKDWKPIRIPESICKKLIAASELG